ncbi:MAG: prepilin-type N-terminal cleavage/methylation domain-containing protein [Opitutaceae bacterium]|nr:prepilin-type N-terminal cleavage/methylation domain-containing protein [Opitutaceae bacterium]
MNPNSSRVESRVRAFTLAEVLAALTLMAIVIPVALGGMSIASRAGSLGQRKAAAARVAQRVLNELIVTGQVLASGQSGSAAEDTQRFTWRMETAPWSIDALDVVTVHVTFEVQGDAFEVSVSTLHDPASDATAATSSAGVQP